jgi:RNA polymerase sigma-70 factor, ECF subfamily
MIWGHPMKYNLPNQTDHLEALRRKDKQAFAKLVDQNATPIYRLALKMVSNEQDAEDILQTTFIKAFKNIEGFEGRSKVSTWLYRIAVNESLMLLRKRKHGPRYIDEGLETDNDDFLPKQIVDWCCLPEKELISSETRTHINQAIKTLSDSNRAAFLLRDVEGLSTRETAKALEISESAVKVRLMRARLQLREELTGFFSEKMVRERP